MTRIDFSEFHPLDHRVAGSRCQSLPGGWRRHVWLEWEYRAKPVMRWWLRYPLQGALLCRLGMHDVTVWWSQNEGYNVVCEYCSFRRPARPDEEFEQLGPGG